MKATDEKLPGSEQVVEKKVRDNCFVEAAKRAPNRFNRARANIHKKKLKFPK